MEFTGERMIPEHNIDHDIYLEHISRYIFASQFVKDKVILDIACGSGYGADLLVKSGSRKVYAVDIAEETIKYCKSKYNSENLDFLVGSVADIPIKDAEVDVIVSMETIEHVDEKTQVEFITEAKRALKPGGIFIVSTPNSLVFPKGNPFHIKELNKEEFLSTLRAKFKNVKLFYQDNVESSYIMSENSLENEMIFDESNSYNLYAKKINKLNPLESMYLIAVCSDSDLDKSENEYITIFKTKIREFYSQIDQKNQIILEKKEELKKQTDSCKNEIKEAANKLNQKLNEREMRITELNQNIQQKEKIIEEKEYQFNAVVNSLRWKIPNYFYKLYKGRIKKFIPRFFFALLKPFFSGLNHFRGVSRMLKPDKIEARKMVKKYTFDAEKIAERKKIFLYIDHTFPAYDKDAGSFVTFEYLRILLGLGYKIIFWPQNLQKLDPYTEKLQQMGVETVYGDASFEEFIKQNGKFIHLALLARPYVAKEFIDLIRENSDAKIIYSTIDLHYLREKRRSEVSKDAKGLEDWKKTKELEISLMRKSDVSLLFSYEEEKILNGEFPEINLATIPWVQEVNDFSKKENDKREGILFLGGFAHTPNADAVTWFHDEIFPIIKKKFPNIKVTVLGSNPSEEVRKLNSNDFRIHGFVTDEDLPHFFEKNKVFIAPLRFGAGFKGKIAMSMSYGLPVVTTSVGAEGMGTVNSETVLIADTAEEFALAIIDLYKDEKLWNKISKKSVEHVEKNYSIKNAKEKMEKIIKSIE